MTRSSTPTLHRSIAANQKGRDFVVGDLHGCYDLLMKKLQQVSFNTETDRLFSVGDLIDRGPNSLKCLELLKEPWFYAVLGNHEAMFLQFLRIRDNFYSTSWDFIPNGGGWLPRLADSELFLAQSLGETLVAELPLRMTVEHPAGAFDVVHAQFYDLSGPIDENRPHDDDIEKQCTWGRTLIRTALSGLSQEEYEKIPPAGTKELFRIEPTMIEGRRLTYVGHTIVRVPLLTKSHCFLDTGGYLRGTNGSNADLTLVEHGTGKIY